MVGGVQHNCMIYIVPEFWVLGQ